MRTFIYIASRTLGAIALIGLAATAQAHDNGWLDSHATPHGGQVRMTGPYHLEMMPQATGVLVYVTDHGDAPIPTAGWTAQVVALSAGKTVRIPLKPAEANTLRSTGNLPVGAQRVLSITPKPGEEYSARFQFAAKPKKH